MAEQMTRCNMHAGMSRLCDTDVIRKAMWHMLDLSGCANSRKRRIRQDSERQQNSTESLKGVGTGKYLLSVSYRLFEGLDDEGRC